MSHPRKGFLAWLRSPLSSARNLDVVILRQERIIEQQAQLIDTIGKQSVALAEQHVQIMHELRIHNEALNSLFPSKGELGWEDPRLPASLFRAMCIRAQSDTTALIQREMPSAVCELDHRSFLVNAMSRAPADGLILEFGVFSGTTLRWLAEHDPTRQFVGFDSFRGLPADWTGYKTFNFDLAGKAPTLSSNTELVVGEFKDTLPKFASTRHAIAMVHIDCDLYDSTRLIFQSLAQELRPGAVIVFDEYFNYPGFREHEYRACAEFLAETGRSIEWFAYCGERVAGKLR